MKKWTKTEILEIRRWAALQRRKYDKGILSKEHYNKLIKADPTFFDKGQERRVRN